MNLHVAEYGNVEKKALSHLNQECRNEEIDEVEVKEFENLIEVSPMKVGMNAV